MTEKDGIVTFECDKDHNGKEILNSTQRNNELIFPDPKKYPKAQYVTNFKNECNITSYIMFLEYSGARFPSGMFKQPEDNLGYFILTNKEILELYKKNQPVLYNAWQKSLVGEATTSELENAIPPTEIHNYLCIGANEWLGYSAAIFSTRVNFKQALWNEMVNNDNPMVISTTFGKLAGHLVCVTGVQYKIEDYQRIKELENANKDITESLESINPVSIIVDDPWGKYDPKTNTYIAPNGGNDIIIPWDVVIARVKPVNSPSIKWAHCIFHKGIATI